METRMRLAAKGHPKVGAMIEVFYENTFTNPTLSTVFDALLAGEASEDQTQIFKKELERIARKIKRQDLEFWAESTSTSSKSS
jgi:hypothetical protein